MTSREWGEEGEMDGERKGWEGNWLNSLPMFILIYTPNSSS